MQHTKCIATNNIANAKIYFSKRDKAIFEGFEGDVFPSFTHSRDFWRIKANVNILSDWKPFRYSASLHLRINRGRVPIKVTLNVQYFSKRNKRDIYIQFKRSCLLLIYSALYLSSYVLMWFQLGNFLPREILYFLGMGKRDNGVQDLRTQCRYEAKRILGRFSLSRTISNSPLNAGIAFHFSFIC